jgi:hypothetical protein
MTWVNSNEVEVFSHKVDNNNYLKAYVAPWAGRGLNSNLVDSEKSRYKYYTFRVQLCLNGHLFNNYGDKHHSPQYFAKQSNAKKEALTLTNTFLPIIQSITIQG